LGAAGFNANPNIDGLPPTAIVSPSRNINLHEGGIGKRGGTAHVDAAAHSGAPRIVGIYDYTLIAGTQFVVRATGDGKIYKDITTTIKTGLGTNKIADFAYFNNKLYFANGNDRPQVWDGAAGATTNLTNIPTDWTGTSFPKQLVIHGRGNSERMWAFACSSTPHIVYASKDNDGTSEANFSDAEVKTTYISTDDGRGIVGGAEFQDRLFCFSNRKTYVIDDVDLNPANWGYEAAAWEGGAANHRLIIKTPNDIICMMEDGEVYSVLVAQTAGDYKAASLSRPSFIHTWIKANVDLSKIADFHANYDPLLRAIRIWVVRQGQTTIDTNLVYFIDRPVDAAWSIHDNQTSTSGHKAYCSGVIRQTVTGNYKLYTGDYAGFLWKIEEATRSDNGIGYYAGIRTPHLSFDAGDTGLTRIRKRFDRGWVLTAPKGNHNLNISILLDGSDSITSSVSLQGAGGVLGSFVLGTDKLGGNEILDREYDIGMAGKRLQTELYNSNAGQDFFISQLMFDFVPLGARP